MRVQKSLVARPTQPGLHNPDYQRDGEVGRLRLGLERREEARAEAVRVPRRLARGLLDFLELRFGEPLGDALALVKAFWTASALATMVPRVEPMDSATLVRMGSPLEEAWL